MTGKRLALTQRDRTIVAEINRFGVASREQLMRLGLFASKTRANERLKRLVDAGHLAKRSQPLPSGGPRLVYVPGRLCPDSATIRRRFNEISDLFLLHQLGLVDIRIAFEQHTALKRWLTDKELGAVALGILPDAFVEYEAHALSYGAFVEYDRGTETLVRIERKIRGYVDLARSGRYETLFNRKFFRVCIVADSPGRLATLSQTASRITDRIFRFTTLRELTDQGPLEAIWRRAGVNTFESLTLLC